MKLKIQKGEVAFLIRANEKDGEWDGTFATGLAFDEDKPTPAIAGGIEVAVTITAFLEFLMDYPDFTDELNEYRESILEELFPAAYEKALLELDGDKEEYETDGNVIKLSKWSKTFGNA
jgi:hypothetical protein